jgi:hypothetical protein
MHTMITSLAPPRPPEWQSPRPLSNPRVLIPRTIATSVCPHFLNDEIQFLSHMSIHTMIHNATTTPLSRTRNPCQQIPHRLILLDSLRRFQPRKMYYAPSPET